MKSAMTVDNNRDGLYATPFTGFARCALAVILALAIMLGAACGGDESDSEATDTPATAKTLSANDASIAELTAAFEAAGISNASRWAREVDEYRPYATDDTEYKKLRGELAKYNPGPGVVDAIIALLHLP